MQNDEDDFSGPALGGHLKQRSSDHSDDEDDEDDRPVTMRKVLGTGNNGAGSHLNVPMDKSKKALKMEVELFKI